MTNMKKKNYIRLTISAVLSATLLHACGGEEEKSVSTPDLTQIRIEERPCETLEYIGKTGNDFDSALDALKRQKNLDSETIKVVPLAVIFDADGRAFYGIAYGDCGMYSDVIDTKGNLYRRSWYCPDSD